MGKTILGKGIIVCATQTLRKRHVNETIVYAKFYSQGFGNIKVPSRGFRTISYQCRPEGSN